MGREIKKSKKAKESKQNEEVNENISFFSIFRYAKWYESLATGVGMVLALLSGGAVSYNLLGIGELSTALVDRSTGRDSYGGFPILSLWGGGKMLVNATHEENMQALLDDGASMGIGMAVSVVIAIILLVVAVALINWSALRQMSRVRQLYVHAALRQDMAWFDTSSQFNLPSRLVDDMAKLKEGMGEKLAIVSHLLGTAIISTCVAFPVGWQLTLACLSVMPLSIAASVGLAHYQTKSSMRELESYTQAGNQAEEVIRSIRTVVSFGGEQTEVARYAKLLEPAERSGKRRGLFVGAATGCSWLLTYSLNAIALGYGTRLVLQDLELPPDDRTYQVGDIMSILFSIYMATQSITFCVPHGESFANARAAAASIFSLIDRKPEIDAFNKLGAKPRRLLGNITVDRVHFSYPSRADVEVLKGFSLEIKAGETVALVGASGCGKSTVLQLVQRLYDPDSGSVSLDGRDVKNLNLNWLRSSLGVVGQEPCLFRGTVYENIALADPEASKQQIQKAAELAHAHSFIIRLPNGYDTVIGERGASLSGGQKQRIAIARALLREPAVLLLDEATSALDPASEKQVQAALDKARVGRTTLLVSHSLSSIMTADRIVYMEQGVIAEQGTHEELMELKGAYFNLVSHDSAAREGSLAETVIAESDDLEHDTTPSRTDVKRRSRRPVRRHSTRRESHDWMTPRGSITSVMSTALQNFAYNVDDESEVDESEANLKASDWELLKLNAPEWPQLLVGSIAAAVQGACFPIFALLFGLAIGVFASEDHEEILASSALLSGMFVVVATIAGISMCLQSTCFTSAGLKMTTRLRVQCFASYLKQEIAYFDSEKNTVGALCARLSGDAAEIQGATGLRIGLIIQGVTSVVAGFIMGMCYDWKLTLVGTAFLPIMVGSIWLEGIVSQQSIVDEKAAIEDASTIATEAVVSVKTVQALGVEKHFLDRYQVELERASQAVAVKTRWRGLVLGMGFFIPFVAYCSATVYGVYLVAREGLEYKIVLLVTEAVMYGAYMLGQSLVYAPSFNAARACGARILSIINREPKIQNPTGIRDRRDWVATGKIRFSNLEFSYPTRSSQRILYGLDLKVEAGKTVALVGPSGCGKSTVLQLLQRFYDPEAGSIELDNRDTRLDISIPRLRKQLATVQQEPILLDRTLGENIAYGDHSRTVPMQDVVAAAKVANIHSFIVSLPSGYDTKLGQGGAQLSGGQKQRVCIARALVRSPRVLLLDEATSALDASSQKTVSEALQAAAGGRTCITIAHRLSTVRDADLICFIKSGTIVEQGTHSELMSMRGHYWKMQQTQEFDT